MGQPVIVVVAELHGASAKLADAAQRLQDGLNGVHDEVTDLLGSGWRGGAAAAYAPVWGTWHEGATKVVEGLQRMSELLDVTARDYTETDESAAQSVGSVMPGTGGARDSGGAAGVSGGASFDGDAGGSSPTGALTSADGGAGTALGALPQLGQTAMQPLPQTGQAIGGLIQATVELAVELTERTADDEESAETAEKESAAATPVAPPTGARESR